MGGSTSSTQNTQEDGPSVYVATETFVFEGEDGTDQFVYKDKTRVAAGHPMLERYGQSFAPVENDVHFPATETADTSSTRAGGGRSRR